MIFEPLLPRSLFIGILSRKVTALEAFAELGMLIVCGEGVAFKVMFDDTCVLHSTGMETHVFKVWSCKLAFPFKHLPVAVLPYRLRPLVRRQPLDDPWCHCH